MVGNMVLYISAEMLEMSVFFVFVHEYGHQEAPIDSKSLSLDQGVPYYIFLASHNAPLRQEKMDYKMNYF